MNRLKELITELCPNGVEYQELNQISEMKRGTSITKKDIIEGTTPVISGGREPAYYCDKYNRDGETITVAGSGAGAGYVQYWDRPIFVCDAFSIQGHEDVNTKYLYYCLSNKQEYIYSTKKGGGVPHVHISSIENLKIPLPPLPVQQEIVRILDSFTELTARRKQYEYYRDELLRTAKNAEVYYLNEISENCDNQRKPVTSGNRIAGEYPYYGASGIVDYVDDYLFEGDYLLISEDGANLLVRNTPIAFSISGRNWVNNHAHVLHFDTYETRKYVEIYLNSIDLSPYITGGAQPKLNQKNLNKIPIPLPAPAEQAHIVSILDRFDALCNDLTSGLPAEIEARQKQYEYYRDKLLKFKSLSRNS